MMASDWTWRLTSDQERTLGFLSGSRMFSLPSEGASELSGNCSHFPLPVALGSHSRHVLYAFASGYPYKQTYVLHELHLASFSQRSQFIYNVTDAPSQQSDRLLPEQTAFCSAIISLMVFLVISNFLFLAREMFDFFTSLILISKQTAMIM